MIKLSFIGETEKVSQGIKIMRKRLHYEIAEDGYTVWVQNSSNGLSVGTENGAFFIRYQHKEKCDIGLRLTQNYREKKLSGLREILAELCRLHVSYEEFHVMLGDAWHRTNKPFGWDALDMHLGAAETRVKWAIHRLEQYLDGKLRCLDELEVERLPYAELQQPLIETAVPGSIMTVSAIHPK